MKNKKRGGKRKGAGRKPIRDKVIPITVWVKKSKVKELGGKEKTKQKIYDGLYWLLPPLSKIKLRPTSGICVCCF